MKNITLLVCSHCGSTNVQNKAWVDANTNQYVSDCSDGDANDFWCEDCQGNHNLTSKTFDGKDVDVIGYQVVDSNDNIHPDMMGSFSVYSYKDAMYMITDNTWILLPIYEGDIEEPTMMF